MRPERWEQIETIFHSTLGLNPEERRTYLARVCEADEVLLKEVESLISAFERGCDIEHPVFPLGLQLMTDKPANLAPGLRIGSYEIIDLLGRGGMGEVYLARDADLCRNVALKLLPRSLTSDPLRILRFQREARAAAAISHPNVAHIYGTGVIDEQHYIAMEFVDGVTLRQRLNNGPISLKEAVHTALEIAVALAAAHRQSIVHRDVKPENVMIRNDGLVKILDFGLAKLSEKATTESGLGRDPSSNPFTQTNPGVVMGTVRYMSPEQIRGQEVDGRTDIWSLGALLYEMIAARAPFEAPTPHDEMALILQREPPPLHSNGEWVWSELSRIVGKALCKELGDRYQQMTELVDDLRRLHSGVSADGESGNFTERVSYNEVKHTPSSETTGLRVISSAEHIIGELKHHKKETFSVLAVFAFIAAFFFVQPFQRGRREVAQPFQEMNITPLSNTGKAVFAVVSPDGARVAHVEESRGRQIITVTHTRSGETQLVDQADDALFKGLTFSKDGQRLYYVRYEYTNDGSLYQTALPDGQRAKLLNSVDSAISFAPDGRRFAFIRYNKPQGKYSLMISNVDGTGEHVVATKADGLELSIEGPAWSPDGKRILCAVGEWNNGHHMKLVTFDIENGQETLLEGESWFSIGHVAWLDDQRVVICAAKQAMSPYQLWRISYPGGEIKRITNDMADYYGVSLSNDSRLISVQSNRVSQIWVASANDIGRSKAIVSRVGLSFGVAWTRDGKVVFSSMTGSELNISVMNADGSQVKQLTMNSGDNYHPTLSADGRYIVFASNRSGTFNIWRMNAHDGSELTQLTVGDANFYPFCSPDNQWVFYENQSEGKPTLWKVPLAGGESHRVSDEYGRMPVISPHNRYIASRQFIGPEKLGITISPIQGGPPVKRLPIPIIEWQRVQWLPDSSALTFIKTIEGVSNIWEYNLDDPQPKLLTDFQTDLIFSYAWSPDFRQLVCVRGSVISDVVAISDFS